MPKWDEWSAGDYVFEGVERFKVEDLAAEPAEVTVYETGTLPNKKEPTIEGTLPDKEEPTIEGTLPNKKEPTILGRLWQIRHNHSPDTVRVTWKPLADRPAHEPLSFPTLRRLRR